MTTCTCMRIGALLLLGLLWPSISTWAEVDRLETTLRLGRDLPLRWDNIEGGRWKVSGPSLHYSLSSNMHVATISRNDPIALLVPRGELLRIYRPDGPLSPELLNVMTSNGSGLFMPARLLKTSDPHSLVLGPQNWGTQLVRIAVVGQRKLELAFFISRTESLGLNVAYRNVVGLDGKSVGIRRADQRGSRTFWYLPAGKKVSAKLRGPCRLRLESRFSYAGGEADFLQHYSINVLVDGEPLRTLHFETSVDTVQPIYVGPSFFIGGKRASLGQLEAGYIEFPSGEHTISLVSSAPVYARLLKLDEPDYLLEKANAPIPKEREIHAKIAGENPPSPWSLSDEELLKLARTGKPADLELAAMRIALDNTRLDGGLVAADLLYRYAESHPEIPEIGTRAELLLLRHSFYRDVRPAIKSGQLKQAFYWFIPRRVADPREKPLEPWLEPQHLRAGLGGIEGGYFSRLDAAQGSDKALTFMLPPRAGLSRLRIAVHAPKGKAGAFWLQMDEEKPMRLEIKPMSENVVYQPSLADAALAQMKRMFGPERSSTLDGPFSAWREPAPLLSNAPTVEMPLPKKVRRIRIWQEGGAAADLSIAVQYRAATPLKLSEAAYLALLKRKGRSDAFALFRRECRRALSVQAGAAVYAVQVGSFQQRKHAESQAKALAKAGFQARVAEPLEGSSLYRVLVGQYATLPSAKEGQYRLLQQGHADAFVVEIATGKAVRERTRMDLASQELVNEWDPLFRLLLAQNRLLTVSEATSKVMLHRDEKLDAASLQSVRTAAQAAEKRGDWLSALQAWGRMAAGTEGEMHRLAQRGRIRALEHLGEHTLASHLRQAIFLYASDSILRNEAWHSLRRDAEKNGRMRSLLPLLAAALLQRDDPMIFQGLVDVLSQIGEDQMALELALLLPKEVRPNQAVAQAAYRLGWDNVLQETIAGMPKAKQSLWKGYLAQRDGKYEEAIELWGQAGPEGAQLKAALQEGIKLRQDLDAAKQEVRERAIAAWLKWQENLPGARLWREEVSAVQSSAGLAIIRNLERGTVFYGAKSVKGKPVRLRIAGPGKFRLVIRPLHSAQMQGAIDDWVIVRQGRGMRPVPILHNVPVPSLEVVGESMVAGRAHALDFSFGAGIHDLEVEAEHTPLLVRAYMERPALPLTVLPIATPYTLSAALRGVWQGQQGQETEAGKLRHAETLGPEDQLAYWLGEGAIQKILQFDPGDDPRRIVEHMRALLWIKEHDPQHAQQALAVGEALFHAHMDLDDLVPLRFRLLAGSVWKPQRMVENSAGTKITEVKEWEPESLRQRVRKALMPPLAQNEVVMPGYQQTRIIVQNVKPTTLHLKLSMVLLPLVEPLPMMVEYQLDQRRAETLLLAPDQPSKRVSIRIPKGRHFVTIRLKDALPDQYLSVRAFEKRGGIERSIALSFERTYYVATAREPVLLNVQGPLWLRIEKRVRGHSSVQYKMIPSGWQRLLFKPSKGEGEASFRFAGRSIEAYALARTKVPRPLPPMPAVHPVPPPLLNLAEKVSPSRLNLHDGFSLGGQEDGTWSLGISRKRRLNAAADRLVGAPTTDFTQVDLWHRYYYEPANSYFRTQGLVRIRQNSDIVLGMTERMYFNAPDWPATFRIDGSVYVERFANFNPALAPGVNQTEWSGTASLTALRRQYISPKWYHVPMAMGFVRHVSIKGVKKRLLNGRVVLEPPPGLLGRIDTDVYTTYKEQHRYGLGVGETLAYRPFLDTLLRASVGLRTNEGSLSIDHAGTSLRWDQRLGDGQLNVGYTWTRYRADNDRLNTAIVRYLNVDFLWDLWQRNQMRWEAAVSFRRYGGQIQTNVGMIGLTVHFGKGRMYRDFMPGELDIPDFLDLRQRQIPHETNNSVWSDLP